MRKITKQLRKGPASCVIEDPTVNPDVAKYALVLTETVMVNDENKKLPVYRIMAKRDITIRRSKEDEHIHKGELGGYVTGFENLSQLGSCWIESPATVSDTFKVQDNALVKGNVYCSGKGSLGGNSDVAGEVVIQNAGISGDVFIHGKNIRISGAGNGVKLVGNITITGEMITIKGEASIKGTMIINQRANSEHRLEIGDDAYITSCRGSCIEGNVSIRGNSYLTGRINLDAAILPNGNGKRIVLDGAQMCGETLIRCSSEGQFFYAGKQKGHAIPIPNFRVSVEAGIASVVPSDIRCMGPFNNGWVLIVQSTWNDSIVVNAKFIKPRQNDSDNHVVIGDPYLDPIEDVVFLTDLDRFIRDEEERKSVIAIYNRLKSHAKDNS
jgi:NDP-sugar pyrophosphorylase family protein